jgi:hypothetical protein
VKTHETTKDLTTKTHEKTKDLTTKTHEKYLPSAELIW